MTDAGKPQFDYGWTIIELERRLERIVNRMAMLEAFARNLDDQLATINARLTAIENE